VIAGILVGTGVDGAPDVAPGISRSGGQRAAPKCDHELAERGEHALVTFAQQGREDVLADLVAPEMVPAIAPRHAGGVEIDPVGLKTASDPITTRAHTRGVELQTALQTIQVDASERLKIDGGLRHFLPRTGELNEEKYSRFGSRKTGGVVAL
jgi:hypothetical protein